METFTVSLPRYDITIPFDYMAFTKKFPDSLITLALQSGESDVPLDNPLVTPQVLNLLQEILTTGKYPYVPY